MRQFIFPLMLAVLLAIGLLLLVTAPETEVATVPAPPSSMTLEPVEPEPLTSEPLTAETLALDPLAPEPLAPEPLAPEPLAPETLAPETLAAEPAPGAPGINEVAPAQAPASERVAPVDMTPLDPATLDAAPLDPALLEPDQIETPPGLGPVDPAEDAAAEGSVNAAVQTEDPAPSGKITSGDPVEAPAVEEGVARQGDVAVDGFSGGEAVVEPETGVPTSTDEAAVEAARVRPATAIEPAPAQAGPESASGQSGAETATEQDYSGAVSEPAATAPREAAPGPARDADTGATTDASEPSADTPPEPEPEPELELGPEAEPTAAAPGSVAEAVSDPAPDLGPDTALPATTAQQTPPPAATAPPESLPSLEVLLTEDGFDPEALTRYIRQSTLGARQKAALFEAIEKAQGPAAQARLVEQLRASLGL